MQSYKKFIKKIISMICVIPFILIPIQVLAATDNRDAGFFRFDRNNGIAISRKTNDKYVNHNEGGFTVYIPQMQTWTGDEYMTNMFTKMFNIYDSGIGSNYNKAAATFAVPGYETIKGIQTKYFVKSLSVQDGESVMATSNLLQLVPGFNVEFRYAGIMIHPTTGQGTITTNPTFVSDFIQNSSGNGNKKTYTRYNKEGVPRETETFYDASDPDVKMPTQLVKNWTSGSGIPDNVASSSPYYDAPGFAYVERVFETWAERTQIGAKWKAYYTDYAAGKGMEWWEVLKDYIRIDGNLDSQSVLLTCVYHPTSGGTRYTTYSIPFPVQDNTIASLLQVVDEKNNVIEYSERPFANNVNSYRGADININNMMTGKPVKLQYGKTYRVVTGLTYSSKNSAQSTTDKDAPNAKPEVHFVYKNNGARTESFSPKVLETENVNIQDCDTNIDPNYMDTSTTGPIQGVGQITTTDTGVVYSSGTCGFKNDVFTVDEQIPESGYIRFWVPSVYSENGDNGYVNDDFLELEYIVEKTPTEDDKPDDNMYGDLNLGRREYRSLHYKKTVEEDDLDKPIMSTDPTTGAQTPTGEYEKKKVDYEYATDYGWYETYASSPEGEKVGEWNGVPASSGSIYPIDENSWWEYDQQWPNQSEDSYYKIWLTKSGDSWSAGDEDYYRSETADYPFTLGFSTARSRGQESDLLIPKIKVELYGISPDTDEDGELIGSTLLTGKQIGTYQYTDGNYMYLTDQYIAERYGNFDYPFIRVRAEIDKTTHGESGIYGDTATAPYHNGWQDEHDTYERTFPAISDDMEISDIRVKDAEGITVYHAKQNNGSWNTIVRGYFDKEEDYTMDVTVKQTSSAGHNVKNPTIDVQIYGQDKTGGNVSTYVDRTITMDAELGLDEETTFEGIAFRPKNVSGVEFNVQINNTHGSTNWRENEWDDSTDTFSDSIQSTTANLRVSPGIEVYNSKNNIQNYLTFAEKLNLKFDIQHIGQGERQMAIVGNSEASPLAKLDIDIYNADALTQDENGNIKFSNVKLEDPKAANALIWSGSTSAKTRLYPGLGQMNYASHVQAWVNNYVVQSYETLSRNVAAYGRILVTAQISNIMYTHGLNENTSPSEDYVQQEFKGEHNLAIVDMAVTGQNSISDNSWYYGKLNKDKESGEQILDNPNGLSVSVAIQNMPSSFADATVVDRTYLDIYINDDPVPVKTAIVDIPQGNTVPVEVVIPDLLIENDMRITAKVNYGTHQTHYEYVLPSTDSVLNADPFTDNTAIRTVSPNLPDTENAPGADIYEYIPEAAFN